MGKGGKIMVTGRRMVSLVAEQVRAIPRICITGCIQRHCCATIIQPCATAEGCRRPSGLLVEAHVCTTIWGLISMTFMFGGWYEPQNAFFVYLIPLPRQHQTLSYEVSDDTDQTLQVSPHTAFA